MLHPPSPAPVYHHLVRAALQAALTGPRRVLSGILTTMAGVLEVLLAVVAGLLAVVLVIPGALITAVARFAMAASTRLVESLVWLSTALSRLSRALAPETSRVSTPPSQTAVPGTDLLPGTTSGRTAQGDDSSRTEPAPSTSARLEPAASGLDIAQPSVTKRGRKRSKMERVPPERTVLAVASPAAAAEPTPPAAAADSSPRRLAPGWGWWAAGGLFMIALTCGFCTVHGFTLAVSLFLCGPLLIGCAWMVPACLRPYDDARRHLRENIAAPWLLIVILVPSNADDQVRQIVASSPVRTTLAALLAVYTWLGVCQAILSVHHDYRERRPRPHHA